MILKLMAPLMSKKESLTNATMSRASTLMAPLANLALIPAPNVCLPLSV